MLKTRAALPIAGLKGDILQLLSENNVLVVCGETGSGKTTQVEIYLSLVLHYYDFGIVILFEVLRLLEIVFSPIFHTFRFRNSYWMT